ncbi:MAG: hypothetical protein DMF85_19510 [Acidobacteria bacterium]|nr:MAG: hypothetical protein DMF85_19510 [Acidobacteriota bacterium]
MNGGFSETRRQAVHISMGAFALLLRWLPWWQAVALAAAALAFNLLLLPRIAGERLYRPGDRERGVHGIVFYPIAVLMLLLAFPHRLDIVAAAWGILALGDGLATIGGRAIGGPRWPWNREKTMAGTASFVVAGAAGGILLAWWCRAAVHPEPALAFTIVAPIAAALVAAAVETVPIRLDDNLSVAFAAGATLWMASVIDAGAVASAGPHVIAQLPAAVAVNAVVAFAGHRARTVSLSGAFGGAIIGTLIYATTGWRGWLLLFVTFAAAAVTSRLGLRRKTLLGIAEERGGRRGAGNAIANTGAAAVASMLAVAGPSPDAARLAFAAALVAGGSDTIASEIGKAWGRRTYAVTTWQRVAPGTSGAVSLEGTAAGIVGALALATVAAALGIVPGGATLFVIVVAATVGSLVESWLGATLESPGILNNDSLNFVNTSIAALTALAAHAWMS